ncbi:MAG: SDR family oxidoreductase [Betaproteobacteria bacterium]|nr:SDR family oxidoreductase [Betaproteobacteria bacterium]
MGPLAAFAGKSILITGASDGIGAELARQLAGPGIDLVLAARNTEKLQETEKQCEARGAKALAIRCDVGVEADCRALVDRAVSAFGRIDILVNNAGVSGHAYLEEVEDFAWYEAMMRVNFFGTLWCTRYALPHLRRRQGLVVGISSLAGKVGIPGRTAYSPSKFAQAGFLEALRVELMGSGVDVTVVYPGIVATGIRVNGYGADGRAAGTSGLKEDKAMSVEECARQIVEAMASRRRELVMTTRGKLGMWLKLIAPRLVDRMALAALKKE